MLKYSFPYLKTLELVSKSVIVVDLSDKIKNKNICRPTTTSNHFVFDIINTDRFRTYCLKYLLQFSDGVISCSPTSNLWSIRSQLRTALALFYYELNASLVG